MVRAAARSPDRTDPTTGRHGARANAPGRARRPSAHRHAEGLAAGELALGQQQAERALGDSAATNLRLRAETMSFLGNIAHEQGKPTEAEARPPRKSEPAPVDLRKSTRRRRSQTGIGARTRWLPGSFLRRRDRAGRAAPPRGDVGANSCRRWRRRSSRPVKFLFRCGTLPQTSGIPDDARGVSPD